MVLLLVADFTLCFLRSEAMHPPKDSPHHLGKKSSHEHFMTSVGSKLHAMSQETSPDFRWINATWGDVVPRSRQEHCIRRTSRITKMEDANFKLLRLLSDVYSADLAGSQPLTKDLKSESPTINTNYLKKKNQISCN